MTKLIECVPNFSEGRDQAVIDAIAHAIRQVPGCTLLDVDPGRSTNRTVYTFVGTPDAVVEGALAGARVARERIDMRRHRGAHPRIGAMDVCPFVPVRDATMDDCVACARAFGERAARELGIPIYLYEHAQEREYRRALRQIRDGEYEGLAARIGTDGWTPDFGPAEFVPTWGATAVGARIFLIAYNVNVLGTKEQAHRIALDVREQGRGPDAPGLLRAVKGMGWFVEEYGLAQVSMNLDDFRVTPPHVAFEACVERAADLKVAIAGSELVGLIPLEALLMAAEFYMEREGAFILDERQKVRLAVERLGLHAVAPFVPEERIIEYMIPDAPAPLAALSVREFVEAVGARSAAPGGGSASALIAALGAALGGMVGWLTYGRRKLAPVEGDMRRALPPLDRAMRALVPMIDADTDAFATYMEALAMPSTSEAERERRREAMQAGLMRAVEVPLKTMRLADGCWDAMQILAEHGSLAMRSDLEVGARALETGIWGACRNVLVNLGDIEDADFTERTASEARVLADRAASERERVIASLDERVAASDP